MQILESLNAFLLYLDGKKAKISGVVGAVILFLNATNQIDPNLATLILSITALLFGSAEVATDYQFGRANKIRNKN